MSPRVDPQERRTEIIEAAMRCLINQGYHNTSMDDIVAESGLSKGTIYWHFKNKKDLIMAVFEHVLNLALGDLDELFEQDLPASEKLNQILGAISRLSEEDLDTTILPLKFMTELLHDQDFVEKYKNIISAVADQTKGIIQQGIENGEFREVDAYKTAWTLMGFFDGVILYYLLDMPGDILNHSQIMADIVVSGLKKQHINETIN